MASPSYTYTLANSTTADADEVMQNFNDILNGVSDGTKDISVAALTVAGNANFNGNTTLGNATGDTITVTGRIASDVNPSANASYDLGSSALSYASLYLDNASTDGGAIYFDAGTTKFIKANAAGTELEISGFTTLETNGAQIKELALYSEAKSASYTITDIDGISFLPVTAGSSGDVTVTLPTAAANTGRVITIKKVDAGTGAVIIDGEGAETIDGAATTTIGTYTSDGAVPYIYTGQGAFVTLLCDGSEWFVINTGGDYVYDIVSTAVNAASSTASQLVGALTIPPGTWAISADVQRQANGATLSGVQVIGIIPSGGGQEDTYNRTAGTQTNTTDQYSVTPFVVRLTTATTYNASCRVDYSAGTPQWYGSLKAIRT